MDLVRDGRHLMNWEYKHRAALAQRIESLMCEIERSMAECCRPKIVLAIDEFTFVRQDELPL